MENSWGRWRHVSRLRFTARLTWRSAGNVQNENNCRQLMRKCECLRRFSDIVNFVTTNGCASLAIRFIRYYILDLRDKTVCQYFFDKTCLTWFCLIREFDYLWHIKRYTTLQLTLLRINAKAVNCGKPKNILIQVLNWAVWMQQRRTIRSVVNKIRITMIVFDVQ